MSSRAIAAAMAAIVSVSLVGCSKPGSSLASVSPTIPASSVGLDTFVGTWASTSLGGDGVTQNVCSALKYDITKAPDNQSANVRFDATCAGFVIAGTGSGWLAGSTLMWSTTGTVSRSGSQFCSFDFKNNTATPEGTDAIRINYSGTVCGIQVSGSQVIHRR